jgi:hypothetical protein
VEQQIGAVCRRGRARQKKEVESVRVDASDLVGKSGCAAKFENEVALRSAPARLRGNRFATPVAAHILFIEASRLQRAAAS